MHRIAQTELDFNHSEVSLNRDNLFEYLRSECHNKETHSKKDGYLFNENGDLIEVQGHF